MLRVLGLMAALILPGQLMAQDLRDVSGRVTYLDRMALGPDAVLIVEAIGPDLSLLAEARIPTEGRQVPIPFRIAIPADSAPQIRAGLAMGGRVVWLGPTLAMAPDDPDDLGDIVLARHTPMGFVADVRCGASLIRLGFADAALVIDRDGVRQILQPTPAASGARYAAPDDPTTHVWLKGHMAQIALGGVALPACHLALPPDEQPWTGGGNEPFWSVGVDAGLMTLKRLGMEGLVMPLDPPQMTGAGDILVTATDPDRALRAVLLRRPVICRDTMSGMPHPETIDLSMGDHTLTGCGGDPARLLVGRTWLVEDIGGAGVIDAARLSVGFGLDGRVAGSGGCNRWFAGFDLTGESLTLGPAGATMMACAPAIMDQERRFFAALGAVRGFDIDATGALVLLGPDGALLSLRAATDGSAP
jgi:heat shock protein HslJ